MARGVIDHGEAAVADLPGDGGGEVGLAEARRAEEQEVGALAGGEIVREAAADPFRPVHVLPVGDAGLRPLGVGVPVQGKALKALIAQVQEPGELLFLLPGIVLPQAAADLAVLPVAPVLAEGAEGLLLQGVLGKAHGAEQAGTLLLQAQVLVPQDLDGPGGVRAPDQGGADDLGHGGLQLPVDVPEPGLAEEDGLPAAGHLLLVAGAVVLIFRLRPAQELAVVCHASFLPVPPADVLPELGEILPLPLRRGRRLLPGLCRAVAGLHLGGAVEPGLVPLFQDAVAVRPAELAAAQHGLVVGDGHRLRREAHVLPGGEILLLRRGGQPLRQVQRLHVAGEGPLALGVPAEVGVHGLLAVDAEAGPGVALPLDLPHPGAAAAGAVLGALHAVADQLVDHVCGQPQVIAEPQKGRHVRRRQLLAHPLLHGGE